MTSFALGVIATIVYQSSNIADPVLTPRQKELQKIAIEAEKSPFFPIQAPVGKTDAVESTDP